MKIKNIELCNWGRYQKTSVPVDISNGKYKPHIHSTIH